MTSLPPLHARLQTGYALMRADGGGRKVLAGFVTAQQFRTILRRALLVLAGLVVTVMALGLSGCRTYPNCDNDDHCYEYREYCYEEKCTECRLSKHCGEGRRCVEGVCERVEKWCNDDSDCPGKSRCRDKLCGPECVNNAECPTSLTCFAGSCQ